ncbi:hypothetical protein [Halosegnis marinus]|uniref:hypothetical protein n=1 Tax=Halosegnis marinus TaxID=3034023 RepID=UPI00360F8434
MAGFDDYLENNVASTPEDFVAVAEAEDLGAQLQALLTEICDECLPCDDDGQLAKFEYVVEYDEEGVVTFDGFRPDGDAGDFAYVSYENKEGATYDPATATFATEYCSVWAVVKAGQEFSVTELTATDGQVTAEYVAPYAISFVAFFCSEDAATAFAESFPSRGRGRNGRRGR